MNEHEFDRWKKGVEDYNRVLVTLANDQKTLKNLMIEHLKLFFKDFDEVIFRESFKEILIIWNCLKEPVMNPEKLVDLNMEFSVSHDFFEKHGEAIIVTLHPFGEEED